jgi:hypothetical protein
MGGSELFQECITSIADAPIILLLAGIAFTATIGIVIALAGDRGFSPADRTSARTCGLGAGIG